MARPGGSETRSAILTSARRLVAELGIAELTLESVAQEVRVTKQAVLYHFGNKQGLLEALYIDELECESAALCGALVGIPSAGAAIRALMTAAVDYYLEDLARFRILYVASQLGRHEMDVQSPARALHVYPTTSRLYDRLETMIRSDPDTRSDVDARQIAVGTHFAALGIASYMGMLHAVGDTLRHDPREIAARMAETIARGITRVRDGG